PYPARPAEPGRGRNGPMTMAQLPPPRQFPESRRADTRALLEAAARESLRPRRRRWLTRTGVAALAGLLLTSGGVATAYVAFRPAEHTSTVRCYTKVDDDQGKGFPGTTVSTEGDGSRGRTADANPVEACGDLWRQGVLRPGADTASGPDGRTHRVPTLRACVLDDGTAAVYPSRAPDVCQRLGFPRLRP